jgi:hypothetical protein
VPDVKIQLPKLDSVQQEVRDWAMVAGARCVMAWARRRGKSKLLHILGLECALRGGICWWILPSRPMGHGTWRLLRKHGHQLKKHLPSTDIREVDRVIHFPHTGGELQLKSADRPDTLQADALDMALLDEAALLGARTWAILEPCLLDRNGSAVLAGTPKGKDALFYAAYQRGVAKTGQWRSWHQTMLDSPYLTDEQKADFLARYKRGEIPQHFWEQEYEGAFLDDAGSVFRKVRQQATARELTHPEPDRDYFVGVDWGRHHDLTWFVVISDELEVVYTDRMVEIDYTLQIDRLKSLNTLWSPITIMAERNSMGDPLIEQLQLDGLPVEPWWATNASNKAAAENLAGLFEEERITIPPDDILISQLQSYEMTRLPSGTFRYAAPKGMHDDAVDALKLAALAVTDIGHVEIIA